MDYAYGYCGMPCALCSRYRTVGSSRCPGCSHDGYYTDPCKVHHCCRDKGLVHCGKCDIYPCKRLGSMSDFSDLYTNHVKVRTGNTIREQGFEAWYQDYCKKAEMLTFALANYNDGRMKRYLCELFITSETSDLVRIMNDAKNITGTPKEKGKAFKELVLKSK